MAWAAGIGALAALAFPVRKRSLGDAVVVVAGGSRGLGLALAERFVTQGAWVVLLARDRDELRRARGRLEALRPGRAIAWPCDVTDSAALGALVQRVHAAFGRIDVWVNNAGLIDIGPIAEFTRADFERVMGVSVFAVVDAMQQVLPVFRHQGRGHFVNIASLGGKMAVPHMASYCAAKFAEAGLSECMHDELAAEGIRVTTVYPGVMRVGSAIQASFRGDPEKEFRWFSAATLLPGLSISADAAARRIVDAVRCGDREVVFPASARLAALAARAMPETLSVLRGWANRCFPANRHAEPRPGREVRDAVAHRWWYRAMRGPALRIEQRWNESTAN